MAEGLLRQVGSPKFEALSAGSRPAGFVHPLAAATMRDMGIDITHQLSKHRDEFEGRPLDIVITLCDAAANEPCPTFAGGAVEGHWSLPDPTFHPGSDAERQAFCAAVAKRLRIKIEQLTALPLDRMTDEEISRRLSWIGGL
jgi:arsenate reductase